MQMQIYTWSEQVYIYTGCIFAHVQINFYIYAIAFTCPKIHPGANYRGRSSARSAERSPHQDNTCINRENTFLS